MTPCTGTGAPDFEGLVRMGKHLFSEGMSAVVYCGSMGDWPLLTDEQRMEGVEKWCRRACPSSSAPARRIRSGRRPSPPMPARWVHQG